MVLLSSKFPRVGDHVEPLSAEQSLDLTEHRFDRVELRTVRHVPDRHDVEGLILGLHRLVSVHSEVVH